MNHDFDLEKQFAFFVVNFQMSKHDFEELTEVEKNFIMKEWENKVVFESTMLRNAVLNAEQILIENEIHVLLTCIKNARRRPMLIIQ